MITGDTALTAYLSKVKMTDEAKLKKRGEREREAVVVSYK